MQYLMYRLHGQDAAWLYRETPSAPMHTLKVFIVRLGPGQVLDFERVQQSVPRLLHEVPVLRQRAVQVPFGLHHPVMIEDPEFDLLYHLNRAQIPAPGGMRELEGVLADITSHPLDQTRPLWQFWVLQGLADNRVVLVQKIHHALADGMASLNSMMRVWQSAYHHPDAEPPPWQPEPVPGRSRLVRDALMDHVKIDIANVPDFFKALYRSVWVLKKETVAEDSPNLRSLNHQVPRTLWNRALSARRSLAMAQLDLAAVKSIKQHLGGTLNDALLALTAGAVRSYLSAHDELPGQPLLVTIPVSTDQRGSTRELGNATAVMLSNLHVEIADPLKRYRAICEADRVSKSELELIGRDTFGLMAHYIPPAIQQRNAIRAFQRQDADAEDFVPGANLSVSNVPGPADKFSALGNVVEELYSAGPLIDGMGLNITAWSYAGSLNFTLVGCLKALPDIKLIADGLPAALEELLLVAYAHQGTGDLV